MAAGAVRRHLDARDELPARGTGARARPRHGDQGDGDAQNAPPRHPAGLRTHPVGDERDELPVGDGGREASRASARALAAAGPVTSADAVAHFEQEHGLEGIEARRAWRAARLRAHLLHHHETALWNGRPEGRFVALDEPEEHDPTEARAEMFRRYFAAFGPASRRDIVAWTRMHVPEIQRALDRLELRRFLDEQGQELLDVPRAPLPDPETPAPVRFLPKWDNVLLAFADRTRVLPEKYRRVVIGQNGDVAQTFLVDGLVAGTWRVDDGRVVAEPFEPLSASTRRELEDEGERLEAFLAD